MILNIRNNELHMSKNNRLSYTFLILEISGATSSVIYGCFINETPLVLSNAINIFFIILILITKSCNIQKCINYFRSIKNRRRYIRPNNIFYVINEPENNSLLSHEQISPINRPSVKSCDLPYYDALSKSVPIEIPSKNKKYWKQTNYDRNNLRFENIIVRENEELKSVPTPSLVFEYINDTPPPSPIESRYAMPVNLLNKNIDEIIENNFNFYKNKTYDVYPPDTEELYEKSHESKIETKK